ncbi:MAG: tannase/feruloyl esterase family alpha/beta hydrolase [Acidobacteria bacterium]|nr:tannase/feruloyl esterase family alpha/beta hydrolase [Acidobacteriota bacterium]
MDSSPPESSFGHNAAMQKLTLAISVSFFATVTHAQSACEKLAQMSLPQANITSVQSIAAGALPVFENLPAFLGDMASLYKRLPPFCRLSITGQPSPDSDIKIEVWLPSSGWNGKFQGQGNGGFAGYIDYPAMARSVASGYATASTDTGHSSQGSVPDASWALRHPEKVIDYGYRAIHQMTEVAKAAITAFYGRKPEHSYFGSCSNGGRQALMEAQRFPEDYDGILAGAPANYWTHLLAGGLWDAQSTTNDPASYIPPAKIPAIAAAVNAACDAQDGVKDGIVNDPRQCRFDPAVLLCKSADSAACLTQPQTVALKKLYEGAHDSSGQIFAGFLPGAEDGPGGWKIWITGEAPGQGLLFGFTRGFFADMVFDNAQWDYKAANLSQATKLADSKEAENLNATDPNLEPFRARGGKLILYHGWNDPAISALNSINYFEDVGKKMGKSSAESFLRLYLVPGMQHCGGGPGATSFGADLGSPAKDPSHNMRVALETWVENGQAPSTIIATKYATGGAASMTRPLCAYPQQAKYKGAGDPNQAESFACESPNK